MRIFIGFKFEAGDGEQQVIPVVYGDMSRQVANVIRENSENIIQTVPKLACYVSGLEIDHKRTSDSSFVSKVNIRERKYEEPTAEAERQYQNIQGGNYTVERLMPTPFKLSMKADIWTSNTDQKLQLLEQILVLFNPSLEIQTTDNYLDWTSLSVVDLSNITFSSRQIPQGIDSNIDICTLAFDMPIWISPPSKVKKLGIIQSIITNVFTEAGDITDLEDLKFNRIDDIFGLPNSGNQEGFGLSTYNFGVMLLQSGNATTQDYEVTMINPNKMIVPLITNKDDANLPAETTDWYKLTEVLGGAKPGSKISFKQANNHELVGDFVINPLDPTILLVTFDIDTLPRNSSFDINGLTSGDDKFGNTYQDENFDPTTGKQYVDMIINPQTFNPITTFGGLNNIPYNYRLLILEDIGVVGNADGADAWAEYSNIHAPIDAEKISDLVAPANAIIAWDGAKWVIVFNPTIEYVIVPIVQNMKTLIKYKYVNNDWVKAFEGDYQEGAWTLLLHQ